MPLLYQLIYTYQGLKYALIALACVGALMVLIKFVFHIQDDKIHHTDILWGLSAFVMLGAVLFGYAGGYELSTVVSATSLFLFASTALYGLVFGKKYVFSYAIQHFLLSFAIFMILVTATFSDYNNPEYPSMMYGWLITAALMTVYWAVKTVAAIQREYGIKQAVEKCRMLVLAHWTFAPIAVLLAIMSYPIRKYPFLWDSADYMYMLVYNAARWGFTTGQFSRFDLCGHKSSGYSILTAPGIWMFNDWNKGLHIMQTLFMIATVFFFWLLVKKLLPKISKWEAALITLMFAVTPAIFAQSSKYDPDYGMLCLLVWVLCAWLYRWDVFTPVFALLFCFTKEPSVILYAGLVIGIYLYRFIKKKGNFFRKLFLCLTGKEWFALAMPPVVWFMIFVLPLKLRALVASADGSGAGGGILARWFSSTGWGSQMEYMGVVDDPHEYFNHFAFSTRYIKIQLEHIFGMNFAWIITGGIVFLLIYAIVRGKANQIFKENGVILAAFLGGIVFYTFFCIAYITNPHYRYVVSLLVVLILLFVILLFGAVENKWVRSGVVLVLAVLFFIQNYTSLDPVTNSMGYPIYTGKTTIYNYEKDFYLEHGTSISDYVSYNLQGNQWGMLLSDAMRQMENGGDTLVIAPWEYSTSSYANWGGWLGRPDRAMYWDNVSQGFSAVNTKSAVANQCGELNTISGKFYYLTDKRPLCDYQHIYYMQDPYLDYSEEKIKSLMDGYDLEITDTFMAEYGSWAMKVYVLKCTNESRDEIETEW